MTRRDGLAIEVARFWSAATIAAAAGPGPLVLAVSGGADSLALLHVLRELAPDMGISLHVAHLDHGMRGADAAGDAAFVSASCAGWGVPCTLTTFDVPGYAARGGLSAEDAARRARYSFLAAVAGEVGAAAVATGHHADDQVETVVGHWLRGAGPTGLGGMAAWGPLPLPPDAPALALALGLTLPVAPVVLLRPLLAVWRAEILAYCAAAGLHPREDASNADVSYRRNHLRHNLLPALEREQPGLAHRLWHSAA
ncbi:MAG TPA: tRNA lysidine(34) synthetase TilS, partial [Chloroflexia bacterium]|nr:tRNA lysidine(34) synthetase TilS [Chloroflexia bacterium]